MVRVRIVEPKPAVGGFAWLVQVGGISKTISRLVLGLFAMPQPYGIICE